MVTGRELWQRSRPVFAELIDLDREARAARVEAIGSDDPQLRDAVEWLLSADAIAAASGGNRTHYDRYTAPSGGGWALPIRGGLQLGQNRGVGDGSAPRRRFASFVIEGATTEDKW